MRNPTVSQVLLTVKGLCHQDEGDEKSESNGSSKEDDDSSVDSDSDDIYDMFHVDLGGSEGIDGDLTGLGRSMSGSSAGSANGTRLSLSFAKKSSVGQRRPSASPRKRRPSSGRRH